jgi:hypothetical protein
VKKYIKSAIVPLEDIDSMDLFALATNSTSDADALDTLADYCMQNKTTNYNEYLQTYKYLLREILQNPNTSSTTIQKIFDNHSCSSDLLPAIAHNSNTPVSILELLADPGEDIVTLQCLVLNPNLPKEILLDFTSREWCDDIRDYAIESWHKRFG